MAPTVQGEWIKVEQKGGKGPGPRSSHGIAVIEDKLYCFGGDSIDKHLYVFDFSTQIWSIVQAKGDVSGINTLDVRMVAVGTMLYVFGGRNESPECDLYSFDTEKNEWKCLTKVDAEGYPEPRTFHSMASDENSVYFVGGNIKKIRTYNVSDGTFGELSDKGEKKRGGAGFLVVRGKIWVVYGFATSGGKDDYESKSVQSFDLAIKEWKDEETTGAKPSARSLFAYAGVGKHILIFGGEIGPETFSNEGYALNIETLVWEKFGGGDEPEEPRSCTASTTATITIYGKKGLLMHGGKLPNKETTDDLYFYAVSPA